MNRASRRESSLEAENASERRRRGRDCGSRPHSENATLFPAMTNFFGGANAEGAGHGSRWRPIFHTRRSPNAIDENYAQRTRQGENRL